MKRFKGLFAFPFLTLALAVSGCASMNSPLMVPVKPSPYHTLPPPAPAMIRIPIVVELPNLKEIEKHLANAVKEDLAKTGNSLTKSMGTTVWWDPLDWDFTDSHLTAKMHVHYKAPAKKEALGAEIKEDASAIEKDVKNEAATVDKDLKIDGEKIEKKVKAGEEAVEKDVKVEVGSMIQWSKDWKLEAPDFKEGVTETQAELESDESKGKKLLRKGTAKFHEALQAKSEMKKRIKEIWNKMREPIRLAEDTWLRVIPDSVSVGSSRVIPVPLPRLETVFEIIVKPQIIFGAKPAELKDELPLLKDYQPGPDGFHAETNLKISFKEINVLLNDPKTGILNHTLPGSGDYKIKITGIRLYGSGGQIVVEAQVEYQPVMNLSSQPAKLTLYLLGTPTYHEKEQMIDFPDMDFDIRTSDFLVQMADFIAGAGMQEELRKKAVIPVGKKLDETKLYLDKALNRPLGGLARLRTTVNTLKLEEAFVSDYGIEGRVDLDGDSKVEVNW